MFGFRTEENGGITNAINLAVESMYKSAQSLKYVTNNFKTAIKDLPAGSNVMAMFALTEYNEAAGALNNLGLEHTRILINKMTLDACVYANEQISAFSKIMENDKVTDKIVDRLNKEDVEICKKLRPPVEDKKDRK